MVSASTLGCKHTLLLNLSKLERQGIIIWKIQISLESIFRLPQIKIPSNLSTQVNPLQLCPLPRTGQHNVDVRNYTERQRPVVRWHEQWMSDSSQRSKFRWLLYLCWLESFFFFFPSLFFQYHDYPNFFFFFFLSKSEKKKMTNWILRILCAWVWGCELGDRCVRPRGLSERFVTPAPTAAHSVHTVSACESPEWCWAPQDCTI